MKQLIKSQVVFSVWGIAVYAITVFLISPLSQLPFVILSSIPFIAAIVAVTLISCYKATKAVAPASIVETALIDSLIITEGAEGVVKALFTVWIFALFAISFDNPLVSYIVLTALVLGNLIFLNNRAKKTSSFLEIKRIAVVTSLFVQYLIVSVLLYLVYSFR